MMELRDLPSVDALAASMRTDLPRMVVLEAVRAALDRARRVLAAGKEADPTGWAADELAMIGALRPTAVINATGVLLNTNLGRAPLHPMAAAAAEAAHRTYNNVEVSLASGKRGGRGEYVARLVAGVAGAEDGFVVNNNAAGLYLVLAALAAELQVVVSRGELIEIGGSFRLPELMGAAGAWLVEVGTTNRTRVADYADAIGAETAMVLKVHPANYRLVGFTEEASYEELSRLASRHRVPFVADIGSGLLDAEVPWLGGPPPPWLASEPAARQTLGAGADLVMFSGDKLLGGPQAGVIVGSRRLLERVRAHPVARAVRCDGPTLAALAATLELYADGRGGELPFWKMAGLEADELEDRSRAVMAAAAIDAEVVASESVIGAGSVPGQTIPSPVIAVAGPADRVWAGLLAARPPVLGRRVEGRVVLDLRAVDESHDKDVAGALEAACR